MTIPGIWAACKRALSRVPLDVLIVLTVLLCSSASFGFGILAGKELAEGEFAIVPPVEETPLTVPEGGKYVASQNGSRYHLPECSGAKNIAEGNRIWFTTKEEAEAAGYTPAANCKGI